jgi:hypothetical protein
MRATVPQAQHVFCGSAMGQLERKRSVITALNVGIVS